MSRFDNIDNKWPERLESDPAGEEERCGDGGGLGRNVGLIWEWISRGNVARTQLVNLKGLAPVGRDSCLQRFTARSGRPKIAILASNRKIACAASRTCLTQTHIVQIK